MFFLRALRVLRGGEELFFGQDLQDWRRIVSRPFDAACSVCTQAAKPQRKRGNGALRIEWEHQPTIRGVGSLEIREFC